MMTRTLSLACLLLSSAAIAGTAPSRLFRIGTGGKTGVYYPIGKIIALGLTPVADTDNNTADGENGVPGYIAVAQNSPNAPATVYAGQPVSSWDCVSILVVELVISP